MGNNAVHPLPAAERDFLFTVEPDETPCRLDRFLAGKLREHGVSREDAKRLILAGKVEVDGTPAKTPKKPLRSGCAVRAIVPALQEFLVPEQGELCVLYEDAVLAVINKPSGLAVHPAPGKETGTLAHRLVARFPALANVPGFRPGLVHRLDGDTSGLMVVALDEACAAALFEAFSGQQVYKKYLAVVHGVPQNRSGVVDAPIGRMVSGKTRMAVLENGRSAKSAWECLYADPDGIFSLLAVQIFSGRTHQVRVHMQHIGHPLFGDLLYGPDSAASPSAASPAAPRQMLHAWELGFAHPRPELPAAAALPKNATLREGTLTFRCPPPPDFEETIRRLSLHTSHIIITGSPGCGKSLLLALLKKQGIPVFSADAAVAALYAAQGDGQQLLQSRFGSRFVPDPHGPVDKAALAAAMRQEPALRREVEAMLHPLVYHALAEFQQEQERAGVPVAAAEIPLYLETAAQKKPAAGTARHPLVIGVDCPFALRRERLLNKRGWDDTLIADVESWQLPEEEKMRRCDIVVPNTDTPEDLAARISGLLKTIEARRAAPAEDAGANVRELWGS